MKLFLLGMLVMYLITSELIVMSERFDWGGVDCSTEYPITWILVFPQTVFYTFANWFVYKKLRYYNVKSVVYSPYHQRWFYCEREDFNFLQGLVEGAGDYTEQRNELYNRYLEQFNKFYRGKLHEEFRGFNDAFNARYIPKSVWINLPKMTKEDLSVNHSNGVVLKCRDNKQIDSTK